MESKETAYWYIMQSVNKGLMFVLKIFLIILVVHKG